MQGNSRIKIELIYLSVVPFAFVGILLCIGLLYLCVLEQFGIPTSENDRTHSMKFILEMILGIPVILIVGWAGSFVGLVLWSIVVNLLSLDTPIEKIIQQSRTMRLRQLFLWTIRKTKFGPRLK
jgi:hypothetical protein